MLKKIHAVATSAVLASALLSAPALAKKPEVLLTLSSFACGNSTTAGQSGYVNCLGSYNGNIDNQLAGANGIFSAMTNGFNFTTTTFFSSDDHSDSGNPFAQDVGAVDSGVIEFDHAQTGSFVIGLKQASYFALYQFNGALVPGGIGISSIIYDAKGVNGVDTKDLSHAVFFGTPTTVSAVPEADTYAMLLAGLGMIGFVARRRKAK